MNQKTSKVEKEFYLRCSYLTLSVLFDKEPLSPALSDCNVVAQLHLKSGASSFSVASQPLRDTAKTARKTIF